MRVFRRLFLVAVLCALVAVSPPGLGVSGGQTPLFTAPMYSAPIYEGLRGGPASSGDYVLVLRVPVPLSDHLTEVGEVYLYPEGSAADGCNGATHLIRIGFDTSGNPTAGLYAFTSCGSRADLGPLPVDVFVRNASTTELAVTVPSSIVNARASFHVLGRTCDGPTCTNGDVTLVNEADFRAARRCNGVLVTIFGTERDDVIAGTSDHDIIRVFGGDDVVRAGAGDDHVCLDSGDDTGWGEAGDDQVLGASGEDTIYLGRGDDHGDGGPGPDILAGASGRDTLHGRGGDDDLAGGFGRDFLHGQKGDDDLNGGRGRDRIEGGAGNDLLVGGSKDDRLFGGPGDDRLRGGRGDDLLKGGGDRDRLWGGTERDRLSGGAGERDVCKGGPGRDTQVEPFGCEITRRIEVNA